MHTPLKLDNLLTEKFPDPDWLIQDFLHRKQFVVAAGEAGVGKSFFWYTAAFGLATGKPFLQRLRCAVGTTLYFDDENSLPDLVDYLLKIWWSYGCPNPQMVAERLVIEHMELSRYGDSWPAYMATRIGQVKPHLVIVDTATSSLGVQDENDNAEAGRIMRSLKKCMAQGRDDAVLSVLKHAKDARVRGAKAWEGVPDQVLVQSRMRGRPRSDGYHNSKIFAFKRRSFGLRERLKIIPVNGGSAVGLKCEVLQVQQNQQDEDQ